MLLQPPLHPRHAVTASPATSRASLTVKFRLASCPRPLMTVDASMRQLSPKSPKIPSLAESCGGIPTSQTHLMRLLLLPPLCMPPPPGPARPLQERQSPPWQGGAGEGKYPTVFGTTPRPLGPCFRLGSSSCPHMASGLESTRGKAVTAGSSKSY